MNNFEKQVIELLVEINENLKASRAENLTIHTNMDSVEVAENVYRSVKQHMEKLNKLHRVATNRLGGNEL